MATHLVRVFTWYTPFSILAKTTPSKQQNLIADTTAGRHLLQIRQLLSVPGLQRHRPPPPLRSRTRQTDARTRIRPSRRRRVGQTTRMHRHVGQRCHRPPGVERRGLRKCGSEGRHDGTSFTPTHPYPWGRKLMLIGMGQPDTTREPGPANYVSSYLQYNVCSWLRSLSTHGTRR